MYQIDSPTQGAPFRIEADDAVFQAISSGWGETLNEALEQLPDHKVQEFPLIWA